MDIDGNGITDNLLVAAPMFFSGGLEKGKVYIYRVTEQVGTVWILQTFTEVGHIQIIIDLDQTNYHTDHLFQL